MDASEVTKQYLLDKVREVYRVYDEYGKTFPHQQAVLSENLADQDRFSKARGETLEAMRESAAASFKTYAAIEKAGVAALVVAGVLLSGALLAPGLGTAAQHALYWISGGSGGAGILARAAGRFGKKQASQLDHALTRWEPWVDASEDQARMERLGALLRSF